MNPHTLLFADSHARDRRGDEQFALAQIGKAAKKHKVKRVILAGDGIDKQSNRSRAVTSMFRFIDRLEEAAIEFWFLQGQHDWDEPPWPSAHRWAKHLHKRVVEMGELTAYGLDFQPYGKLQEEMAVINDAKLPVNFLIAHQTWGDWMGDIAVPQGEFVQVPGPITHLFTGDLHQKKLEKHKNADGDKMFVCSPGATCAQKIDEPHEHYYVLLGDDGIFRFEKLKSRVFIDWDVMVYLEDQERFMAEIEATLETALQKAVAEDYPEELQKPYLRVTYSHKLPDTVRRVEKAVSGRAILYFKEMPPEEKQASKTKQLKGSKEKAVTPLSVLDQEVDKKEEPEVYELTARLLQSTNYEDEFARWRSEFLGDE